MSRFMLHGLGDCTPEHHCGCGGIADTKRPRKVNTAHQGRRVEWSVRDDLTPNGYEVFRAAGSRGPADLIAIKPGEVLLISVKRTTPPGPAERADLLRVAAHLPGVAVPLVALGPASRVTYRLLTGPGPRDWVPWIPDQIGGAA